MDNSVNLKMDQIDQNLKQNIELEECISHIHMILSILSQM